MGRTDGQPKDKMSPATAVAAAEAYKLNFEAMSHSLHFEFMLLSSECSLRPIEREAQINCIKLVFPAHEECLHGTHTPISHYNHLPTPGFS